MEDTALLNWLVQKGDAVVRWRTASELTFGVPPAGLDGLQVELLHSRPVREWLPRLTLAGFPAPLDRLDAASFGLLGGWVHGSKPGCLENGLGKLAEFGLRAGMPGLDERLLPLMAVFQWQPDWKEDAFFQNAWERLVKSILGRGLLRLGYVPDPALQGYIREHLRVCWKIARDQVYDLYAGPAELSHLPIAWAGKPILKQEVMATYWLPTIHDHYLFANLPAGLLDEDEEKMLAEWTDYILDPRFQALREGYGYAWVPARRTCSSWGWSPHLPGFGDFSSLASGTVTPFLSRLELLARLPTGRESAWLRAGLQYLEGFRGPQGKYRFPPSFLREAEGYYVSGFRLGLGENRRKPEWAELESTFRMLKIKQLLETGLVGKRGTDDRTA